MQTNYWLKNSQIFIVKVFFFKTSFISALMIAVSVLFFSSTHCCFVYLGFQQKCLWRISTLKEEKNERVVFSFCFVSFVLNVVFVYNELTNPNPFSQISFFHSILMFILKQHLALYVKTWVRVAAMFVTFVCISYFAS